MASSLKQHFHFLLPLLFIFTNPTLSTEDQPSLGTYCNTQTNFTTNSQTSTNIVGLLPKLVQATNLNNGFIATSYNKFPNSHFVYGLAQCRQDISTKDCSSCIQQAAKQIRIACPNQADARIWYDYCFLRYNTNDFIGKVDTGYGIFYYNIGEVTNPDSFNKKLGDLADQIELEAVKPANKGLGKGEVKISPFLTLYGLVQCTRDLSPINCAQCLAIAIANFQTFCNNKKGCRVLYSSCYVRYELYPFYFPQLDSEASVVDTSKAYYNNVICFLSLLSNLLIVKSKMVKIQIF